MSGSGTLSPADLWNGRYSTPRELRRLQAILSGLPTTAEQDIDILARMARPPLPLPFRRLPRTLQTNFEQPHTKVNLVEEVSAEATGWLRTKIA